jgi:O-antigen biosynthesis protein
VPTPVKVLAVGNYACANVGDELLLATLTQWVGQQGGQLTAITLNPAYTFDKHGIEAVSYYDLPAIAAKAREADVMVLGGGGMFTDRFMFTLPQLYSYPSFTLAQFAAVCYLAKQFDLNLVLWGQGVGPLRTEDARKIVRDLFRIADHVSVRDPASAQLLRDLGVERTVRVAPDPVWAMEWPMVPFDLCAKFPQLCGKKVLVVNPLVFERSAELSAKMIVAIRQVVGGEWACLWIAFQKMAVEYDKYHFSLPSDRPLIDKMIDEIGSGCTHVVWDAPDIQELPVALAQADAALLARFHGVILGLRAGIPLVAIEYDEKVTQVVEMAGMPREQRLRLDDDADHFCLALRRLLGRDANYQPWRPDASSVSDLVQSASVHRQLIADAVTVAATRVRSPWQSGRYDWLFAWCTQIDARRWQLERQLRETKADLDRTRREMEAYRCNGELAHQNSAPMTAAIAASEMPQTNGGAGRHGLLPLRSFVMRLWRALFEGLHEILSGRKR